MPTRNVTNWLLWHLALDWGGEKRSALSVLAWGVWVTMFRPLAETPGWHYLAWSVAWQPIPVDLVWGPLLIVVGMRHFLLALQTYNLSAHRLNACIITGCLWAFFTVALFLNMPGSTGVPVYGMMAWDAFATYYQLALRARGRRELFSQ